MIKPLFPWAGGKSRMIKHHAPLFPKSFNSYCEPFFGGGAVFCYLFNEGLLEGKTVLINDLYYGLYNIYNQIKYNPAVLLRIYKELEQDFLRLDTKQARKEFYNRIRHRHGYFDFNNETEEAALHLFLLKTCFNGVMRFNKVANGRFGTAAGFACSPGNTKVVMSEDLLMNWHKALQSVEIKNKSYEFVDSRDFDFIYVDPPYRQSQTEYIDKNLDTDLFILEILKYYKYHKGTILICNRASDNFFEEAIEGDIHYFDVKYQVSNNSQTPAREVVIAYAKK